MDNNSSRVKFNPSSAQLQSDVRLQFIDWAKQHGHNPATGAAAFVALQSDLDLDHAVRGLDLPPDADLRDALRDDLAALARQEGIAVQFPAIYAYTSIAGIAYRYALMLVTAEDGVEWTGRVWQGLDYQGMLTGRCQAAGSNCTQQARLVLERELDREYPGYVQS